MMRKLMRKLFATAACLLAAIAMVAGVSGLQKSVKAEESGSISGSIMKLSGASIRFDEPAGIRFEYVIEKDTYDDLAKNEGFKTGLIILPERLVPAGGLDINSAKKLVLDTTGAGFTEERDGGAYRFKGYIFNIPNTEYETRLSARAFVYYNGEYTYSETITRSVRYVAERAYCSADTTPEQKEKLKTFVRENFDRLLDGKISDIEWDK